MAIIEYNQGCGNNPGCFGPREAYYTIFGSMIQDLFLHAIVAILLGLVLLTILFLFKKKRKNSLSSLWILIISVLAMVSLFLVFALLFPVLRIY